MFFRSELKQIKVCRYKIYICNSFFNYCRMKKYSQKKFIQALRPNLNLICFIDFNFARPYNREINPFNEHIRFVFFNK